MAYNWGNNSHETPWKQQEIILCYTDCQFDHSLNIPHDCIYDLETCSVFDPSGPGSDVCAACHYPRSSHPEVTSTPLRYKMAALPPHRPYWAAFLPPRMALLPPRVYNPALIRHAMARLPTQPFYPAPLHNRVAHSPTRPYWAAFLHHRMAHVPRQPYYPAHRGESSTSHAPQITHSPPGLYPAHRGEASTRGAPELTHSPLPQPAAEPGPAKRRRVRALTQERSKRLHEIVKGKNYKALKDYSKAEVEQICAELGIRRRCFTDWIYRNNLAKKEEAAREAAANEEAAR